MTMLRLESFTVELGLGGSYRDAVLADSPLAYWPLGEFRASTGARDFGSGGNAGTYSNVDLGALGSAPEGGCAARFTPADLSHVDMGNVAAFRFTGVFSVEIWFKTLTSDGQPRPMIAKSNYSTTGAGWNLWFYSTTPFTGDVRFYAGTAGPATFDVSASTVCNDGNWHQAVATWTGTTAANGVKLYIDGVLAAQGTASASAPSTPSVPLYIGGNPDATQLAIYTWDGDLCNASLYAAVLSPTRVAAHYAAGSWTALAQRDVVGATGANIEYGISGNGPRDRLASSGTFTFTLRNDAGNSAGLLGYYSPNSANCRSGFDFGVPVRAHFVDAGTHFYRFWGRLEVVEPTAGRRRAERAYCRCTAHDYMYRLAQFDLREVSAQVSEMEDSLLYTILEALPPDMQPLGVSIDAGLDTYPYAFFDLGSGEKATSAINKVVMSAWGKCFVTGNGTFTYKNRHSSALRDIAHEFNNDMVELRVPSSKDQVYDKVRMTTHQRTLGALATETLYAISAPIQFTAGETKELWGTYRSPADDQTLIGGTDFTALSSGTDWAANDTSGGGGTNRTASYTVTAEPFASTVKFTVTNGGAGTSFLNVLQQRGRGIYDPGPFTVEAGTGSRELTVDLPYQDDAAVAQDLAQFVLNQYETLANQAESLALFPEHSPAFMDQAMFREPDDLVVVTEDVTGLAAASLSVHQVRLGIRPGPWITCEFGVAPNVVGDAPWELDASELDAETVLGFA